MNDWYLRLLEEQYDYLESEHTRQLDETDEDQQLIDNQADNLPAAA